MSLLLHPQHQLYVLLRRGRRYAIEFDPCTHFSRLQVQPGVRFILGVHPNETRRCHTMRFERRDLCHGCYAVPGMRRDRQARLLMSDGGGPDELGIDVGKRAGISRRS